MPDSFGKYEVLGLLGEGGFGKVYRGRDPDLKREVAIKTCSFDEDRLQRRFVQEAEVAAGLQHPNIVTVHDFGREDGEPYLVQDLLEGEDLDVLIREDRTGDLETKLSWLRQIAEGLRHAHRHDVVHRDVKPGNVRVSPDGRVRILDFGIAKVLTATEEITRTGASLGTGAYISPEALQDMEVDHRADIFSFGVLAYELVSGRRPFEGDSISQLFYQITHEEPFPVREVAPDCDPDLAACIDRCLEKDRERRHPHFDAVLDDLDAVEAGIPDTRVETSTSPDSRAGWVVGAAVGLLLVLGAAFGASRFLGSGGEGGAGGEGGDGASTAPAAVADSGASGDREGRLAAAGAAADSATGGPAADGGPDRGREGEAAGDGPSAAAGTSLEQRQRPASGGEAAREGPDRDAGATDAADGSDRTAGRAGGTEARDSGTDADPAAAAPGDPARAGESEPAAPTDGVVVVVRSDGSPGRAAAENVLLRQLADQGWEVADRTSLELQARASGGDAPGPGALGRRAGSATVVLASFRSRATQGVGASYTGSATLSVRTYDTRSGALLDSETFQVGGGGTPGEAGSSPEGAATRAAEKVAHQAAFALESVLREHIGSGGR